MLSKKEISEKLVKVVMSPSRTYYEFRFGGRKFSVNTYSFVCCSERVLACNGFSYDRCDTKQDFIDFLFRHLN